MKAPSTRKVSQYMRQRFLMIFPLLNIKLNPDVTVTSERKIQARRWMVTARVVLTTAESASARGQRRQAHLPRCHEQVPEAATSSVGGTSSRCASVETISSSAPAAAEPARTTGTICGAYMTSYVVTTTSHCAWSRPRWIHARRPSTGTCVIKGQARTQHLAGGMTSRSHATTTALDP